MIVPAVKESSNSSNPLEVELESVDVSDPGDPLVVFWFDASAEGATFGGKLFEPSTLPGFAPSTVGEFAIDGIAIAGCGKLVGTEPDDPA
jgi:hypothetical protein